MGADLTEIITEDAINNLQGLFRQVQQLQSNDYYRPISKIGATSNPPTQLELQGLLGTPSSYSSNMVALLKDTTNNRDWLLYGDTATDEWYYTSVPSGGGGFTSLYPAVTVASGAFIATGNYPIAGVPVTAKGVSISILANGTSAGGSQVGVYPDPSQTAKQFHVSHICPVAGQDGTSSGIVPTRPLTPNQVFITQAGVPFNNIIITCNGYLT